MLDMFKYTRTASVDFSGFSGFNVDFEFIQHYYRS